MLCLDQENSALKKITLTVISKFHMKFKMIVVVCWLNVYEGKIDLEIPELFVSKHFTSFIAL